MNKKASSYAEKGGRLTIYIDLTGEDGSRRSLSGLKSGRN
ncbi:MAG: branched-chain amino acid aminotransferase, partial [Brucella intermedia]